MQLSVRALVACALVIILVGAVATAVQVYRLQPQATLAVEPKR